MALDVPAPIEEEERNMKRKYYYHLHPIYISFFLPPFAFRSIVTVCLSFSLSLSSFNRFRCSFNGSHIAFLERRGNEIHVYHP